MDGMYGLNSTSEYSDKPLMSPENLIMAADYTYSTYISPNDHYQHHRINMFGGSDDAAAAAAAVVSEAASMAPAEIRRAGRRCGGGDEYDEDDVDEEACSIIKAKIASHPSYPKLLNAYIDCQKVGAPPEIAYLLEEMSRESAGFSKGNANSIATTCFGADPELDEFMETYCNILVKYKSDLSRPFDEATMFLNKIEMQLGNLCKDNDAAILSSDDELSGGETDGQDLQSKNEDRELKERLMRKYGNHISSLKLEFSKKKKKGKLPKEARQTLLEWWNVHYKWPYPTEADKIWLAESTGLDQKQINNWFINQRKRHWKPSENMQLAVMDSLSGQFFVDD